MPTRWSDAAVIRRRQIETGIDITFCKVFIPYYTNLLETKQPNSVLEVGCGTGHISLLLTHHSKTTYSLEPSPGMYAIAREVLKGTNVVLHNCTLKQFQLPCKFDLILSHLVLQVIDDLGVFLSTVKEYLLPSSLFVFSLPHPCFYNNYKRFFQQNEYSYMLQMSKEINFAITKEPDQQIAGVPYHHRPLSVYFNLLERNGLCVRKFDEIFPSREVQRQYGSEWREPRYCVFHCGLH